MGKSMSKKGSGGGAKGIVGVIVAVAIVAIAGAAGWYVFLRPTPEKVVTKFLDAMYDGKPDVAKMYLAETSAKDWDTTQRFITQWFKRGETADKKGKPYTIGKSDPKGTAASVQVTTPIPPEWAQRLGGITTMDFLFVCAREKGGWKVDIAETIKQTITSLISKANIPGAGGK